MFAALLFTLPVVALPQDAPEAWLSRVRASLSVPFEADQEMTMSMIRATHTAKGKVIFLDEKHFKLDILNTIEIQGQKKPQKSRLLNVGDGKWMWMENSDLSANRAQVRRIALSLIAKTAKEQGRNFSSVHPASRFLDLADQVDFNSLEQNEKTVTLKGDFTEAAKSKLIRDFNGRIPRRFEAVIDRKTGFPLSFVVRSYMDELVNFEYRNFRVLNPKKVDPKTFVYDMPKGASFVEAPAPPPAPEEPPTRKP